MEGVKKVEIYIYQQILISAYDLVEHKNIWILTNINSSDFIHIEDGHEPLSLAKFQYPRPFDYRIDKCTNTNNLNHNLQNPLFLHNRIL